VGTGFKFCLKVIQPSEVRTDLFFGDLESIDTHLEHTVKRSSVWELRYNIEAHMGRLGRLYEGIESSILIKEHNP